jgi:hypothetical protein
MDHHEGWPASNTNQPGPISPSSSIDEVSEHPASGLEVFRVTRVAFTDMQATMSRRFAAGCRQFTCIDAVKAPLEGGMELA